MPLNPNPIVPQANMQPILDAINNYGQTMANGPLDMYKLQQALNQNQSESQIKAMSLADALAQQSAKKQAGGGTLEGYYGNQFKASQQKMALDAQKEQQAMLKSRVDMAEAIAKRDPKLATDFWNKDPELSKLGKMDISGNDEIKEVKNAKGEVVARFVKKPNSETWEKVPLERETASDVKKTLTDIYGKEWFDKAGPKDKEQAYEKFKRGVKISISNTNPGQSEASFKNWPDEVKESVFQNYAFNNVQPLFGWGDKVSRSEFTRDYNAWLSKNNISVQDVAQGRAQSKYWQSAGATNTLALVKGIEPRMKDVISQYENIATDIPGVNWAVIPFKKYVLGNPKVTEFEATRNGVIKETERALTSTGAMSDSRIAMDMEALKNSNTPKQMKSAFNSLLKTLQTRVQGIEEGPFPKAGAKMSGKTFNQDGYTIRVK